MKRSKIVAGNWKCNKLLTEGIELLEDIESGLSDRDIQFTHVLVAPPLTHLEVFVEQQWDNSSIGIAAQNCSPYGDGAYTGEVSARMLADLSVDAVIIGHSERRQYFNEDNPMLAKKVKQALDSHLLAIYCVGETQEERQKEKHFDVIKTQLSEVLSSLADEEMRDVVIAYEPVWAIGSGLSASPAQVQEMHAYIRKVLTDKFGHERAEGISILYGGSVKPDNAEQIFAQADVDGGLIGGASLVAKDFLAIIDALEKQVEENA